MRKIRESIFLKLLLVFVLAAAANILVLDTFKNHVVFNDVRRMHRNQNMGEYAHYLAHSIGFPPSSEKIKDLSNRMHLRIRVEGPRFSQVSSPDVPDFSTVESKESIRFSDSHSKVGKFGDFLAVEADTRQAKYLFLFESEDALEGHSKLILSLMTVLLLILLMTYLLIRHILAPLRSIEKGAKELSRGNLDVSIPLESKDELGRLVKSFNRMIQQVRMMIRSKEQLLLDVSHEFRSPLTRIKVAMEIPGEDARDSIKRSIRELETMISELLESARLNDAQGKLKLETINLSQMLKDLSSRYENEKPGVYYIEPYESIHGQMDPSRIRIALQNILENAIKYSSHQDRPVEVSIHNLNHTMARILVRDFGVGISKEEQTLIFEPFYRIDRSRVKSTGGYGLGLSLCQRIVKAHGGEIQIKSIPGEVTAFSVDLPL